MREPFAAFIKENLGDEVLLIACGLPGTWKTETTEEAAKIKGYPILRTDLIRKEVMKKEDIFDEKVASNMDKRKLIYDEMFKRADDALNQGSSVILDATFVTRELRREAAAIAAKYGRTFVILQTSCPQEVSVRRILARTKENYVSNALTEQAYLNNKKKFQSVDLGELKETYPTLDVLHLTVDTTEDPPEGWYIIGADKR